MGSECIMRQVVHICIICL